jgi:DNA-binding transcriptional MerR regulator
MVRIYHGKVSKEIKELLDKTPPVNKLENPVCKCGEIHGCFWDKTCWKCPQCLMQERDRLKKRVKKLTQRNNLLEKDGMFPSSSF